MPIAFSCSKFSSISQRSSALHLSFFRYFFMSLFRSFLFLLHHHHWHFSASNRGFLACSTAAQNVSSTQGSCCCPVARSIFSYIRCGFCLANSATLRIPSSSKSRNIAGPIEISSPSSRVFAAIKSSLTHELYFAILH